MAIYIVKHSVEKTNFASALVFPSFETNTNVSWTVSYGTSGSTFLKQWPEIPVSNKVAYLPCYLHNMTNDS